MHLELHVITTWSIKHIYCIYTSVLKKHWNFKIYMKYVNLLFIHISYIFFSNCNVFENRCIYIYIYIYKSVIEVNFSLSPLLTFVCFLFCQIHWSPIGDFWWNFTCHGEQNACLNKQTIFRQWHYRMILLLKHFYSLDLFVSFFNIISLSVDICCK